MNDKNNEAEKAYLSVSDVYNFFCKNFWLIFITTSVASAGSIFYSLSLNDVYQSKSILITNTSLTRINESSQSGLSGLTSLSAFGIGSSGESLSNLDLAYETLISRTFFEKLAKNDNFIRDLYALESYDTVSKKLVYKKELYDIKSNKWVKAAPLREVLYKKFNSQVMFIARDRKKGFIILNIRSISPQLSYEWHRMIVDELNQTIKTNEVQKSMKNIDFLKSMSEKETNLSMKQTIAALMSHDLKKIMLSNSSKDYSLEYLEQPFVPEKKVLPRRSIICIIGTMIGFIIAIFFAAIKNFLRK